MPAVDLEPDLSREHGAWHALPGIDVLRALHVDARVGLTSAAAAQRLAEFGPNAPATPASETRRAALLRHYVQPMSLLLGAAGIGCFVIGEWLTGCVALAVSV